MSIATRFALCVFLHLCGLAMFVAVWPMLAALDGVPATPQSLFMAFVFCAPGMLFIGAGAAFSWSIR